MSQYTISKNSSLNFMTFQIFFILFDMCRINIAY